MADDVGSDSVEKSRSELSDLPDTSELDARLKTLGSRANSIQAEKIVTEAETAKRRETERKDAVGLGRGLQIAYAIIGFPTLGFVVGLGMDLALHTGYWKGFIGLAGCVLAVVSAMLLIKQANADP